MSGRWWIDRKELPGGRSAFLIRLMFGWRITVGRGEVFIDDSW